MSLVLIGCTVYCFIYALSFRRILSSIKNPYRSLSWILFVTFIPVLGMIVYFLFGRNIKRDKIFTISRPFNAHDSIEYEVKLKDHPKFRLIELLHKNYSSALAYNEEVNLLFSGPDTKTRLLSDISKAKNLIYLEYYIVEKGVFFDELLQALKIKISQGVNVRLLYDGFGSLELDSSCKDLMTDIGIKHRAYMPFKKLPYIRYLNYRNHRKIAVIDNNITYIGGMNISDNYLESRSTELLWKDVTLRIVGDSALNVSNVFEGDWLNSGGALIKPDPVLYNDGNLYNNIPTQIVAGGADSEYSGILQEYFTIITDASDYVYIITPYFVPTEAIITALKTSALSGIDVRILLPYKSDFKWLKWCTFTFIKELLAAGVRVYLYHDGFLHGKVMISDDSVISVGSANIDERSFTSNFEINAVVYDAYTTIEMRKHFILELEKSEELTLQSFNERADRNKFLESVARLTSPML